MTLMSLEDSPEEEHSSFFYQVNVFYLGAWHCHLLVQVRICIVEIYLIINCIYVCREVNEYLKVISTIPI